ncbi:hypothetical protein AGLY_009150 [Aphis glycines]|uniref:Uncharacterized protein n=1 Tax=Aphis glycines TaxID=307491 RepID=A0A6G0TIM5_APHGL|nr:hypothetical protein AGLY_009150 [Aphis glycines]
MVSRRIVSEYVVECGWNLEIEIMVLINNINLSITCRNNASISKFGEGGLDGKVNIFSPLLKSKSLPVCTRFNFNFKKLPALFKSRPTSLCKQFDVHYLKVNIYLRKLSENKSSEIRSRVQLLVQDQKTKIIHSQLSDYSKNVLENTYILVTSMCRVTIHPDIKHLRLNIEKCPDFTKKILLKGDIVTFLLAKPLKCIKKHM